MGLLEGKNILVTGVTMRTSIAYAVVDIAQREGANVVVSAAGRAVAPAQRAISKLETAPPLIEVDVTDPDHLAALPQTLSEHFGDRLDGIVHSIAYADPETALGGKFLSTGWDAVANAVHISAYSLQSLTMAAKPMMGKGASIVGLPFDATVTWPPYDCMGDAKAALEASDKYMAMDLGPRGIRVNSLSAGPIKTLAASGIGDFRYIMKWNELNSPLRRNVTQADVGKSALYLLSDLSSGVTGETHHVDAGYHVVGMKAEDAPDIDVVSGRKEAP